MAHRMFPYGRPEFQSVHPGEEAQTIHTQQVSSFELGYLEGSRYGKMHGMKTPEKDTDRMEFHANRGIHLRRHYEWGYIHGKDYAGNLKSGTKKGDKKAYKAQDERAEYLIKARDHGKKLAAVRFKKQRSTFTGVVVGKSRGNVLGSYSSKSHKPQKQKPYSSKQGPGSGWHGEIARHRMAAMKGRRG